MSRLSRGSVTLTQVFFGLHHRTLRAKDGQSETRSRRGAGVSRYAVLSVNDVRRGLLKCDDVPASSRSALGVRSRRC